jgi:hypothetical protein
MCRDSIYRFILSAKFLKGQFKAAGMIMMYCTVVNEQIILVAQSTEQLPKYVRIVFALALYYSTIFRHCGRTIHTFECATSLSIVSCQWYGMVLQNMCCLSTY